MTKKILIAKINSAHGIKGDVNITIFSNDIANFEKYQLFDEQDQVIKLKIISKKNLASYNSLGDAQVIARIENISDRNSAEKLRNLQIFTNRNEFVKTKKNEFYIVDLIGLKVLDNLDRNIGKVSNVLHHGATPILEITFEKNSIPQGHEEIDSFAFINDFFPSVDIVGGLVYFNLPETN